MKYRETLTAVVVLMGLAGCHTPTTTPHTATEAAQRGNPAFYIVNSKRYDVKTTNLNYHAQGIASWYGPDFHGKRASDGETYDMYAMTAAHKTLPIPTMAKVTNLENGHSIIVKINDRGPFKKNRLIDLSYAAAKKLGMIKHGTALVSVDTLAQSQQIATPTVHPNPHKAQLYLQVGAFSQATNAKRLSHKLIDQLHQPAQVAKQTQDGRTLYRVQVGPLPTIESSDHVYAKLQQIGLTAWTVVK